MLSVDRPAVNLSYIYDVYLQPHGLPYIYGRHVKLTLTQHNITLTTSCKLSERLSTYSQPYLAVELRIKLLITT